MVIKERRHEVVSGEPVMSLASSGLRASYRLHKYHDAKGQAGLALEGTEEDVSLRWADVDPSTTLGQFGLMYGCLEVDV